MMKFTRIRLGKSGFCLLIGLVVLFSLNPGSFADNRQRIRELQSRTQNIRAGAAEMRRKKYEKMRAAQQMNQSIVANQQKLEAERRSLHFNERRLDVTRNSLVFLDNRLDSTMGDAFRLGQDA